MEIIKIQKTDSMGRKIKKTIIKTTCDFCGKEFEFIGGIAHFKRRPEHFCSQTCQANRQNIKQGNKLHGLAGRGDKKDKRYTIWCSAKKRAKLKGQEFNLEIESNKTHSPLDSSPSLDRIDSKKGYIKGNVQIISNRANRIKADATVEEIEKVENKINDILFGVGLKKEQN